MIGRRPRRCGRALAAAVVLAGTALAATCAPAAAQQREPRLVVLEEPDGTAVGVSVLLNAGSAWEMAHQAGVTYVAAHAVLGSVHAQLRALGAHAETTCDRSTVRFTLLAPASTWRVATDLFLDALFRQPPTERAIERAKATVLRLLRAEHGNPEHAARITLQEAFFGREDRWARAACGRPETIEALSPGDVHQLKRARFVPSRAAAAVAGPVSPARARALLAGRLGDISLPVLLPSPRPATIPGYRIHEQNTVTNWVGMAFPLPANTDPDAVRLLGFHLERALGPSPARTDVYAISTEIRHHGSSSAFVVTLVTEPTTAAAWPDRVRDVLDRAADAPLSEEEFRHLLRRHRGERLLELAAPEDRARDAARQLFYHREYRPTPARLEGLTPDRLRSAADALGEPATAVLGPRATEGTP